MPIRAVLLDLGGTLADYYDRAEWPGVLAGCIEEAAGFLEERGLDGVVAHGAQARLKAEQGGESRRLKHDLDWKVFPLEDRLARAFFPEGPAPDAAVMDGLCRAFLKPVFARGRLCADAIPALTALQARGVPMAIVSNMPWGAPTAPWAEEVRRLGLDALVPTFLTCRDAGWRKPDQRIFDLAAARVGVPHAECLFVGDEPVWDYEGATNAGMQAVLIDRDGRHREKGLRTIRSLAELPALV